MDKELIDYVWKHYLPKEFKEEVKRVANNFSRRTSRILGRERTLAETFLNEFIDLFGRHNLTSDAEGEEMLYVSRKRVQEIYTNYDAISTDPNRPKDYIDSVYEYADGVTVVLDTLFGSKCLPDETKDDTKDDTKEPKFKVGDRVRIKGYGYEPILHKGDIGEILDTNDKEQCFVLFKKSQAWIYADCLEHYTEPKEETSPNVNISTDGERSWTTNINGWNKEDIPVGYLHPVNVQTYDTYEQALSAGISAALELIKKGE